MGQHSVCHRSVRLAALARRVELPLAQLMSRHIPSVPGRVFGGKYTMRSDTGFTFDLEVRGCKGGRVVRVLSQKTLTPKERKP